MVPSKKYNTGEILPRKVTSSSSDHPSNSSTSTNNKILARAQHKISLSAIRHNYSMIEEEAARQKCSVIAVVKADAYGHGAALTSKYLAERCGASAFAVATIEEAIKIRKVFPIDANNRFIRILVLGPPINYPRCFDTYFHHGIEVMICSHEVAHSLMEWANDEGGRKLRQVESAALDRKEELVKNGANTAAPQNGSSEVFVKPLRSVMLKKEQEEEKLSYEEPVNDFRKGFNALDEVLQSPKRRPSEEPDAAAGDILGEIFHGQDVVCENQSLPQKIRHVPSAFSATLSQTSGHHLANEVRSILLNHAEYQKHTLSTTSSTSSRVPSPTAEEFSQSSTSIPNKTLKTTPKEIPTQMTSRFRGIEDVARNSRHKVVSQLKVHSALRPLPGAINLQAQRRRLRWHALVDTGMGRLGFKQISDSYDSSVEVIKALVDLEMNETAPLEFFGMCTHMADAVEGSDYTRSQMVKFVDLLHEIRHKGINVPTCSTDNSSALLTSSLQHFDTAILLQKTSDTRGFVRCGGAIYGQRPMFPQLRAVSALSAYIRHVAIMNPGDTVGYDRAFVASNRTRIATVSIGFADGYPRDLGNGVGRVSIRGHSFPIAGNVCMDMLMVDLGPNDGDNSFGGQVEVGDEAILWGPDESDQRDGLVRLQDVARILKTTQSALTCGLNIDRVERSLVS